MFMTTHPQESVEESAIEHGNPDQDAYAFLKMTVAQALEQGRFRPELADADLIAQLMWAGLHGVISLRITHGEDPWCSWHEETETISRMIDVLFFGLLRPEAEG